MKNQTQRKTLILVICIFISMVFTFSKRCCNPDKNEDKEVSVTLDIKKVEGEISCNGKGLPDEVSVQVSVYNDKYKRYGHNIFPPSGTHTLTVEWHDELGEPDAWKVEQVVRIDGSPICESMTCPAGCGDCVDVASKRGPAPIGTTIYYRILCNCRNL